MATGMSLATANALLNALRGTAYSVPALYVQLHVGDPGASGTANVSAVTSRNQLTWTGASGASVALSSLASYSMTATESISYISIWDAATAGSFIVSGVLSVAKPVTGGDTLSLTALTATVTTVAA